MSFFFFSWLLLILLFHSLLVFKSFYLSQSDSKSHQTSRTLFSILADLNNAVYGLDSSASLFSKPLVTVSSVLSIISNTSTLHVLQLFQLSDKIQVFISVFVFFLFLFFFFVCGFHGISTLLGY